MPVYFLIFERAFFEQRLTQALAPSWRQRSFAPCVELCRSLLRRDATIPLDALVRAILANLPFDRNLWRTLAGECLIHGACAMPRLQTAPATLRCLLAPADYVGSCRQEYAPIDQVHFGTRDVVFGSGYYRPDHAGLNNTDDVARLTRYLEAIDPSAWRPSDLEPLADCPDEEERAEELAFVRDWWPELVKLYQNARDRDQVIVCETE